MSEDSLHPQPLLTLNDFVFILRISSDYDRAIPSLSKGLRYTE